MRAVLGALAVALLMPATASASAEPDLIAYEALTGGVFTIRADGSGNREIVPDAHGPVWSPDGSRLLYDLNYGEQGLWTAAPDGTDRRPVLRPEDLQGAFTDNPYAVTDGDWLPSGGRIAFVAQAEDERERSVTTIGTARTDGGGAREFGGGSEPTWIRGGRRIAYTVPDRRQVLANRIVSVRRDGSGVRTLVAGAPRYRDNLDASPDGNRLAYMETRSASSAAASVRVVDLRTGRVRTVLAQPPGIVNGLAWTAGGTRLALMVSFPAPGRWAPSSLFTVRRDGTDLRRAFALPFEEQRGLWGQAVSWRPR